MIRPWDFYDILAMLDLLGSFRREGGIHSAINDDAIGCIYIRNRFDQRSQKDMVYFLLHSTMYLAGDNGSHALTDE